MAVKKYTREIKVGLLTVLAVFLLYFGFNFLKGVNIFSPTHTYCAVYSNVNGLTEQAPVYVRGYKVGQVDKIQYNFAKEDAFAVHFSVDKHIKVPRTAECALIADGLLGGTALQINIPVETDVETMPLFASGDTLPSIVVPGLMDELQNGVIANLSSALVRVDSLVDVISSQLEDNHLKNLLANADRVSADLTASSAALKKMMNGDVPVLIGNAKEAVADINLFADNLREVDIAATVQQIDSTVAQLNSLVQSANSSEGTVGLLLNNKDLYLTLTQTVASADSLLTDLKSHPKRYVHFSLFGKKEK